MREPTQLGLFLTQRRASNRFGHWAAQDLLFPLELLCCWGYWQHRTNYSLSFGPAPTLIKWSIPTHRSSPILLFSLVSSSSLLLPPSPSPFLPSFFKFYTSPHFIFLYISQLLLFASFFLIP